MKLPIPDTIVLPVVGPHDPEGVHILFIPSEEASDDEKLGVVAGRTCYEHPVVAGLLGAIQLACDHSNLGVLAQIHHIGYGYNFGLTLRSPVYNGTGIGDVRLYLSFAENTVEEGDWRPDESEAFHGYQNARDLLTPTQVQTVHDAIQGLGAIAQLIWDRADHATRVRTLMPHVNAHLYALKKMQDGLSDEKAKAGVEREIKIVDKAIQTATKGLPPIYGAN